jgi:hypothetical protein
MSTFGVYYNQKSGKLSFAIAFRSILGGSSKGVPVPELDIVLHRPVVELHPPTWQLQPRHPHHQPAALPQPICELPLRPRLFLPRPSQICFC